MYTKIQLHAKFMTSKLLRDLEEP